MKYIKKRYRLFYLPMIIMSLIFFLIWKSWDFLMNGIIPEREIDIDIEGFEGVYRKVYTIRGKKFLGEKVDLIEK